MAYLRAEIKRGFLRSLWRDGETAALSLRECLDSFQAYAFSGVKSGRLILGTAGAGTSVNFTFGKEITQEEVLAFSEELFNIYDDAVTALGGTPADADIFTGMMADDRMQKIRSAALDLTTLRYSYGASR